MLEKLGASLKGTLQKIAKSIFIDEKIINELIKEIQRALLQSDVNVRLVFDLSQRIKDRALKEQAPPGLNQREHLINIVYEELTKFMGGEKNEVKIQKKAPFKIMLVGLFGSGKTTTAGKLAKYYSKRGFKVALLGLDVHRPAAMDQLKQIGDAIKIPAYIDKSVKNAVQIWDKFAPELTKYDIAIIDTAGRDALSSDLIEEISTINQIAVPDENMLVISADIGQAAQRLAEEFKKACGISGVIVTKMDGTAKGGGALSACAATSAPIKFIGVGEKTDDFEVFNPKGFVSRLLGMGDIEALLEKVKDAISEEEAEDIGKKLLKGEFNLIDLYEQMKAMKKMGPLTKVLDMVPGFGQLQMPKEIIDGQEEKIQVWENIMNSCTKEELEDPEIIDNSRMERIARGSGTDVADVRDMVKQFRQSKKMLKMLKGKDPEKMMKKMGGLKNFALSKMKMK